MGGQAGPEGDVCQLSTEGCSLHAHLYTTQQREAFANSPKGGVSCHFLPPAFNFLMKVCSCRLYMELQNSKHQFASMFCSEPICVITMQAHSILIIPETSFSPSQSSSSPRLHHADFQRFPEIYYYPQVNFILPIGFFHPVLGLHKPVFLSVIVGLITSSRLHPIMS